MNRSKYLAKNVITLAISNFSSKILIFLLVPLYTSVLSTDEVGIYDLIVSMVLLLFPMLTLNIVDAVMRFLMDDSCGKKNVLSIGIVYIFASDIIVGLLILLLSFLKATFTLRVNMTYVFLYYFFYGIYQFFTQAAKGLELVTSLGIAGVVNTITTLAANYFFLVIVKSGLSGFLLASVIGYVFPVLFLIYKTEIWNYLSISKIDRQLQRAMILYCTPLIVTVVGWWVNSAADKYIVSAFCGISSNGIFSVSYKIPGIINALQVIFIQAWQISAIKEYGEDKTSEFYGRTFILLNAFISISCSMLIILSRPIASILYQKDFYIAWKYVPFLLVSSVFNTASGFLGPILTARKASKEMALSAIYGAISNIIMNVILIQFIGVQGAAIATAISSFIIYIVRKKMVGEDIQIDNISIVYLSWILLAVQALIEIISSLWVIEVIIVFVLLIINAKSLNTIINMRKHWLKDDNPY